MPKGIPNKKEEVKTPKYASKLNESDDNTSKLSKIDVQTIKEQ